ncbi:MAG: hypothetical protein WKF48_11320 [Solirubrobacteraceae bacterium]
MVGAAAGSAGLLFVGLIAHGAGLPETYFLASDGKVVAHVIGRIREPQLQAGLRAATAGRRVETGDAGDRRSVR